MDAQGQPTGLLHQPQPGAAQASEPPSQKALALVNDPNYMKSRLELAEYTLKTVDLDPKARESWMLYAELLQKKLAQLGAAAQ